MHSGDEGLSTVQSKALGLELDSAVRLKGLCLHSLLVDTLLLLRSKLHGLRMLDTLLHPTLDGWIVHVHVLYSNLVAIHVTQQIDGLAQGADRSRARKIGSHKELAIHVRLGEAISSWVQLALVFLSPLQ